MIIAVDGPAASGKGTIARALAKHYGLPHLDTGLLYRAVGVAVMRAGGDPGDAEDALHACNFDPALLDDPGLRTEDAGKAASLVSAHMQVREALIDRQREFATQKSGAVLDGRDIGTVIAPDADAKLFVTASSEARAQRRFSEITAMGQLEGQATSFETVLADILARDERDSGRTAAPLRKAEDADLLDTSDMGIDAAVQRAIALVEARAADR
jgi:cytidylate kinase